MQLLFQNSLNILYIYELVAIRTPALKMADSHDTICSNWVDVAVIEMTQFVDIARCKTGQTRHSSQSFYIVETFRLWDWR